MHGIDARRVRTRHLAQAKAQGTKITALTSYDALTAAIFDEAGIDLLLVGDSAANVVLGQDSTLGITLDEMITMARAVAGAAKRAFVVCDLPFGSYEESDAQAVASSVRLMKEAGVAAVKIEGGVEMAPTIRRIVDAGIPVVAHIGYTPQSEHALGGHVVQGRGDAAERLLADAAAVAEAGACAVVLEMVPAELAARVTAEVAVPTIGIGAGAGCDGQILVWTDAFGLGRGRAPRFVRRFAQLGEDLLAAARTYADEVEAGTFPAAAESFGDSKERDK
ncbi:3-methyl-2-oxobutanoate hydroxymethyltransferase [Corynebacterium frankenforstense DSM 45800]|uniref:3-methyl-2-oxobutanoate hydroxymethyltransferase n=1 Tax=Corynebacterium frankenforstense DSM 45800 TaxID=1437875 RepID=A0A1L7CU29_9CORY|nr:3-methyl-2-oxobutanoate hydroxymethyltransferase [Corynebacterium frankenforstense]APT89337.1 3-methyl-2-oxobutanoate hydroxymethyltransferase [Corynebacterium frankenforstense DSM 45800]